MDGATQIWFATVSGGLSISPHLLTTCRVIVRFWIPVRDEGKDQIPDACAFAHAALPNAALKSFVYAARLANFLAMGVILRISNASSTAQPMRSPASI